MIRVAINGYGRIGRVAHRVILEKFQNEIDIVAINAGSSTDLAGWMYLLKYDSVYGPLAHEIKSDPPAGGRNSKSETDPLLGDLVVNERRIPVYSQKDPAALPWKDLSVDVVIESTGAFRTKDTLQAHLTAGAKAVILSAPSKGSDIPTFVLSINNKNYNGETILDNASCTTNCIAPVAKIMDEHFGIEKAMMTTIHGYTSDQRLHDGGHKDYRRARAASLNIIPTSTGATKAVAKAMPQLKDMFTGLALRVPVAVGSLADFTFLLKKSTTVDEINTIFQKASEEPGYKGILACTTDPIVSSDIIGNPHSSIVDLSLTQVVDGNMVKVIAWYDNEYGYANRLVEEVVMVGNKLSRK